MKHLKSAGRVGLFTLSLCLANAAFAQQQAGTAAPTSAAGVSGVPENQSAVISVTARAESNIPRSNDLRPNTRGLDKSDLRITPGVQVSYAHSLGRQLIGLNADMGYDFYMRNSQLDRERIAVSPFANLDLPVCDVALLGQVSRRQSDLGELVYLSQDPGAATKNAETRRRVDARLICGGEYGLRPTFEYDYNRGDNSSAFRQLADFRSTRLQTGLSYSNPNLGDISIYALRTETTLPNQLTSTGQEAGYLMRGAGLQYGRAIGTRLVFDGSVSYIDLQPRSGSLNSRNGINAAINFTLTATPRLQLAGTVARKFTSSLTSNATYELAKVYGLTATYAMNNRVRLRAGGRLTPRTLYYDVDPVGPFITDQRQLDIFGGASIDFNKRFQLSLDAGYQKREANLAFFDYENFYVSAGISVPIG